MRRFKERTDLHDILVRANRNELAGLRYTRLNAMCNRQLRYWR